MSKNRFDHYRQRLIHFVALLSRRLSSKHVFISHNIKCVNQFFRMTILIINKYHLLCVNILLFSIDQWVNFWKNLKLKNIMIEVKMMIFVMVLALCKDGGMFEIKETKDKYLILILFNRINLVSIWKMHIQQFLN